MCAIFYKNYSFLNISITLDLPNAAKRFFILIRYTTCAMNTLFNYQISTLEDQLVEAMNKDPTTDGQTNDEAITTEYPYQGNIYFHASIDRIFKDSHLPCNMR